MYGIGGKLYFDPARPVERDVLERMNIVPTHWAPDGAGVYCSDPIGLAHRWLSIIDLSPAGHQPMAIEDGAACETVAVHQELISVSDRSGAGVDRSTSRLRAGAEV